MLESKLQDAILALNHPANTLYYSVKVIKANVWGFPDLITLMPGGKVLLIELKANKALKLGLRQKLFLRLIKPFNTVHRIFSLSDFIALVGR